jgi:hypothetical protein
VLLFFRVATFCRCYFLSQDGGVIGRIDFHAADDASAVIHGRGQQKELSDAKNGFEVWNRWLEQAKEVRAFCDVMHDETSRERMLDIARTFELLARASDQIKLSCSDSSLAVPPTAPNAPEQGDKHAARNQNNAS